MLSKVKSVRSYGQRQQEEVLATKTEFDDNGKLFISTY